MPDLETLYRESLRRCAPHHVLPRFITPDLPSNVVAIGKAAGTMFDAVAAAHNVTDALVITPHGYPKPTSKARSMSGGHPQMDDASLAAGEELLRFVDVHDEILFLVSGGGSACVDAPLTPWFTPRDLIETNSRLVASDLPIHEINCVRKHLSAIKGGRIGARVRKRSATFIYSDVRAGDLASVASGPTVADSSAKDDAIAILERLGGCDRIVTVLRDQSVPGTVKHIDNGIARVVASNETLTATASVIADERGFKAAMWKGELEGDVAVAVEALLDRASTLRTGQWLVAGGETTVVLRGRGQGGRCSEMATRFAIMAAERGISDLHALFGSSDGVDGNSRIAASIIDTSQPLDVAAAKAALAESDSLRVIVQSGRAVIMPPTGNNLRDLYLVARS